MFVNACCTIPLLTLLSIAEDFHIQYQHDNDDQEEDCSNDSHYIAPDRTTGGCVTGVCGSRAVVVGTGRGIREKVEL